MTKQHNKNYTKYKYFISKIDKSKRLRTAAAAPIEANATTIVTATATTTTTTTTPFTITTFGFVQEDNFSKDYQLMSHKRQRFVPP